VFAAWSLDLEGEQPGPLAREPAAGPLGGAARLHASAATAAVARVGAGAVTLGAGRPDSAVGWLLVCRELGLLAGEIGRVHRARGELQRAHEIETDLHGELEQVGAQIDVGQSDPVELDAETEAARRAREPLGPAPRQEPERPADVDDVDAADRFNPTAPTAATLRYGQPAPCQSA
jgi:hypothetical protein